MVRDAGGAPGATRPTTLGCHRTMVTTLTDCPSHAWLAMLFALAAVAVQAGEHGGGGKDAHGEASGGGSDDVRGGSG